MSDRRGLRRARRTWVVALLAACLLAASAANPEPAGAVPNPCDLPGADHLCSLPGDVVGGAAGAAGDAIMRGVTAWVTNLAVWITTRVGELIAATTGPDVQSDWFERQYGAMLGVAGMLAVPLLLLAGIQAVIRQDLWMLVRAAFGYLPMAFILAAGAVVGAQLLVVITDDLSRALLAGFGNGSDNLLGNVADAFSTAIEDDGQDAVPLFGIFLGALVLAIGSIVLWLELVIRDAIIYIAVFFLPLTFVAMIWPATGRYARRLVEFLVAVILAKLVIVAIIGLAAAALTHSGAFEPATAPGADDDLFQRMVGGAALLILAAYSPFALLRAIPLIEAAAHSVGQNRSTMGGAAAAAGMQTPSGYMRQAMARQSAGYAGPAAAGRVSTTGGARGPGTGPSPNAARAWGPASTGTRASTSSASSGGVASAVKSSRPVTPVAAQRSEATPSSAPPRPAQPPPARSSSPEPPREHPREET